MKKYYFIFFLFAKNPSALDVKKTMLVTEGNTVINVHPAEWMAQQMNHGRAVIKFYKEITAEEYNYFQEKLEKAAQNIDSQH